MHADQLRACLDSADASRAALLAWGVRDHVRGHGNLTSLAAHLGVEPLAQLTAPLARLLPRCPDPDMALNNLDHFFANSAAPALLPSLLEGRGRPLEILLNLLATSQMFSDLLAQNPDCLDMLRIPLRRSPGFAEMRDALQAEVDAAHEDGAVLRAFRRFRHRQLLRIGANDIIRDRPLEEVTRDISRVADAALEVALATALRHVTKRFGEPATPDGRPIGCVLLAFGKHGGEELNYSSDIDLMFVYAEEGETRGKRTASVPADEYFARVVSELVRLLAAHTDRGQAYRVDLRLRPEGQRGPLARSLASTLSYYDTLGRTWERQALIKLRPVAGDLEFGDRFLTAIEGFVYRKYLSFSEINDIKAMKRRIEQRTAQAGASDTEVKTGRGGIRDIEFTIQFLQLLNGGDLPAVRQRNTLAALSALEQAGCLTDQEYRVLDDSYRFLRKIEHRLQLLFDLQTHQLPAGEDELRKLALRMGYAPRYLAARRASEGLSRLHTLAGASGYEKGRPQPARPDDAAVAPAAPPVDSLEAFRRDWRDKTEPTRRILDHLLHQTFAGDERAEPESDLILDPAPDPQTIRNVLGRYPFRDVEAAYANLVQLAQEVPFLSPRRCRHFLASLAPALLRAIAETPDPDLALLNLEKVTASLGGKAVLWELFSFNAPSLKLYVDLCAWSQFLSEILINNPGMIDELLDSLVLNQPRNRVELLAELQELCKGATDLDPILHSFQDKEFLRIGVRDILGKDSIQETTASLSDLAETILAQLVGPQQAPLTRRHGVPLREDGAPCRFVLLALGKLGGRELNYHSDLDLVLIYEADGQTGTPAGCTPAAHAAGSPMRVEGTENFLYFTELAQRLIKALSQMGPQGRLYAVDMRLRPTGRSGSLVLPLGQFSQYFAAECEAPEGGAALWERQALMRARVVYGEAGFAQEVNQAVTRAMLALPWRPGFADEIAAMRDRLAASRPALDLKRGPGGLADVEFLMQLFQLKYGRSHPTLRTPNTWQALTACQDAGQITADQHAALKEGYDFLLRAQSRLRIVHNRTLDAIPEAPGEVEKLARRLGYDGGARFLAELERHRGRTRELFLRLVAREGEGLMAVLSALVGLLLVAGVLSEVFEVLVLPRRVTRPYRLTRLYYRAFWVTWKAVGALLPGRRRETWLSGFGPLSLFVLFALWAAWLALGFALLQYAVSPDLPLADALYLSGATFTTLGYGDVTPHGRASRALAVVEAASGFGYFAVVIGYLPVLYQSFSRRETLISLLDSRAGSPPSAGRMLLRLGQADGILRRTLEQAEVWSAELLESHLSYPVLSYYRSQHDNQSWLASLVCVLDACALVLTVADGADRRQARLTFAMARHTLVDLALVMHSRGLPACPTDRLPAERLRALCAKLRESGAEVRDDEAARAALAELRGLYEGPAAALARYFGLHLPDVWPESERPDNWRTSAWARPAAPLTALGGPPADDHFT